MSLHSVDPDSFNSDIHPITHYKSC